MARIDTTLAILDARRHIVGGYVVPFLTRHGNGTFFSRYSHLIFTLDPLPIFVEHDCTRAGLCGLAALDLREAGYYATVQLYQHPESAYAAYFPALEVEIAKGNIAFSFDAHQDGYTSNDGGHIPVMRIFGASLCEWSYIRPNRYPTPESYTQAAIAHYGPNVPLKVRDSALELAPIPAWYGEI